MVNYILYFSLYSFLGWSIETIFSAVKHHRFINRGFLNGPFCPMYGFASVLLILAGKFIGGNYLLLYLSCFLGASIIEYATGFILETLFNAKWWDYSENKFNLKGRICLSFSLVWGLVGVFIIKILQPLIDIFILKVIPSNMSLILSIFLVVYFSVDLIFTLYNLSKLKGLFMQLEDIMSEIKGSLSQLKILAQDKVTLVSSKSKDLFNETDFFSRELWAKELWNRKEIIDSIPKELKERYENVITKIASGYSRIFNAFPQLSSKKFKKAFNDIREKIKMKVR